MFLTAPTVHSQTGVSIRGYFFVDDGDVSVGTDRRGEGAREGGKGEKKVMELDHRETIQGVEWQRAWGSPRPNVRQFIRYSG